MAKGPGEIPKRGWRDIFWRVWQQTNEDRILSVSGSMAFFTLLALFPGLSALVALYGLFADNSTIGQHLSSLAFILPAGAYDLVAAQVDLGIKASSGALGLKFALSVLLALWSANSGMKATFDGLNVAYDESERRSFVALNLQSLAFTMLAIFAGIVAIAMVIAVPIMLSFLRMDTGSEFWLSLLRWPVLIIAVWFALVVLYRFGPSREQPKWRWVTWGSALAALLWVLVSSLFSWYVAGFGSYDSSYGPLGAIIAFMTWIWLSATVILLGAEINAEMEHQTARDSTTGPPQPLGKRGAEMADTIGAKAD
ncbi:YihY/virulence factor BrkB family protein [Kaistia soli]|uniref:YihY/virulence factor BrkB family protein n=1 Tax=Kaistia soli TaxID=446684 RepID=UPI001FCDA8E1|nr:YihY/virulence factor BrkB family protein [Kaistia soli]